MFNRGRRGLRRARALSTRRCRSLLREGPEGFEIAEAAGWIHRDQTKVAHQFGAGLASRIGDLGKISLRETKQAFYPAHGRASPDLDQSLVQKGSERSLINALESLVDSTSGARVHPFSTAIVTSWDLYMRWDFQHQCSIPLLSTCLGHRNNFARATLMASSCCFHRHDITFVFRFIVVFRLLVTISPSSLRRAGAYQSAIGPQRVRERME